MDCRYRSVVVMVPKRRITELIIAVVVVLTELIVAVQRNYFQ